MKGKNDDRNSNILMLGTVICIDLIIVILFVKTT